VQRLQAQLKDYARASKKKKEYLNVLGAIIAKRSSANLSITRPSIGKSQNQPDGEKLVEYTSSSGSRSQQTPTTA